MVGAYQIFTFLSQGCMFKQVGEVFLDHLKGRIRTFTGDQLPLVVLCNVASPLTTLHMVVPVQKRCS